jgi:hypothetical protein
MRNADEFGARLRQLTGAPLFTMEQMKYELIHAKSGRGRPK